ncbi:BnaC09g20610D [Brassica napus]|uniref:BnaC09g20610D protein n=1 Tax=Brassica napus TaxID=3708 RepID=A0A078IGV0_BRANA|nr:BnaC09g20610D [Brassica napus]
MVSVTLWQGFLCCLLAGLSICWFNTVCFVLCIRNFPANRSLALSLTVSFNGVSAALYTLAYNAINPISTQLYLLLNALIPLIVSFAALIPIIRQPPLEPLPPDGVRRDSFMFLLLNILAVLNGVYLLLFGSKTSGVTSARLLFGGSILLLILPLCLPEGSGFILLLNDDVVLRTAITPVQKSFIEDNNSRSCCSKLITRNQLGMLGEEHPLFMLLCRSDFWLYYIAYFCGGTIGLVYSNNLGQIAQSLGQSSETTTLVTLYSSFSFFGRLLSATPDYIRAKFYFARTGWLAVALFPTTVALFLLASSGSLSALQAGTALIGLSSGFIFAAAVSITSELFGPNSVGVNHNILITNIPIGSLVYGFLAALVYESHSTAGSKTGSVICMGRDCYFLTFVWWGCLSVIGLASSVVLFLRTRRAYQRFEQDRIASSMLYS